MVFWWVLGALSFPVLSILFVVYPRRISNADWYGHFTEDLYLYLFPPTFMFAGWVCFVVSLERMGLEVPVLVQGVVAIPLLVLSLVGLVAVMGVPMPGFLTPRWVRERRRREKQEKRRKRREKRQRKQEARLMKTGVVQ